MLQSPVGYMIHVARHHLPDVLPPFSDGRNLHVGWSAKVLCHAFGVTSQCHRRWGYDVKALTQCNVAPSIALIKACAILSTWT